MSEERPQPALNRPEPQDEALGGLAQMFLRNPSDPTPGSELFDAEQFDFTVESLAAMDSHLGMMRTKRLTNQQWNRLILRAGAYVGEVIRRNSPARRVWHWLDYKGACAVQPLITSYGMSIGTAAALWDGKDGVIFPAAKVEKFIQNGPEDSLKFYVQVIIGLPPPAGVSNE